MGISLSKTRIKLTQSILLSLLIGLGALSLNAFLPPQTAQAFTTNPITYCTNGLPSDWYNKITTPDDDLSTQFKSKYSSNDALVAYRNTDESEWYISWVDTNGPSGTWDNTGIYLQPYGSITSLYASSKNDTATFFKVNETLNRGITTNSTTADNNGNGCLIGANNFTFMDGTAETPPTIDPPEQSPPTFFETLGLTDCTGIDLMCYANNFWQVITHPVELLQWLFLPPQDYWNSWFEDLKQLFENQFGGVYQSLEFVSGLFTSMLLTNSYPLQCEQLSPINESVAMITFPGTFFGSHFVIDLCGVYRLSPSAHNLLLTLIRVVTATLLIFMLLRKLKEILMGGRFSPTNEKEY